MSGWRGSYIRAFIAMIGFALIFAGLISSQFFTSGVNFGQLFLVIGAVLIGIAVYLWYKDFQR